MKTCMMLAMLAGMAAAQPVQWRVEDGGNGHWYERSLVADRVSWEISSLSAISRGGHLVTITSGDELGFLSSSVGGRPSGDWIGLIQDAASPTYSEPSGGWRWVTGEPMVFSHWGPGEPNDGGGGPSEQFGFQGVGFEWRDSHAAEEGISAYVIEWEADCNNDGIVDKGQILSGQLADLNSNGIPDGCENPCTFNRQPQPQPLLPGGIATFSVEFARLGQAFQWRRNGTPLTASSRIVGITTPSLTISSVGSADQGLYDCVVTGSCGTVTSSSAALSCTPIIVSQPPSTARLTPGLTLTVGVPTSASYTYRWRQNGQNLFNIPGVLTGATTRTLTLVSDDASLVGGYDCVLTSVCGTTTSSLVEVPCPADFNGDGGIDGGDVETFFDVWATGDAAADVNQDGGVDGGDVGAFFSRWENGC